MEEEKLERSIRKSEIPGLTREEEEAQLAKVIGIAEQNLEQAKADIRSANEDLADLMETYDAKEAEGLALWNNATAKLNAYQHGMARLEKARKKLKDSLEKKTEKERNTMTVTVNQNGQIPILMI